MSNRKSTGTKISKTAPAISPDKLVDEIKKRAYELHIERGSAVGSDMDDWLNAEREIKAKYQLA